MKQGILDIYRIENSPLLRGWMPVPCLGPWKSSTESRIRNTMFEAIFLQHLSRVRRPMHLHSIICFNRLCWCAIHIAPDPIIRKVKKRDLSHLRAMIYRHYARSTSVNIRKAKHVFCGLVIRG